MPDTEISRLTELPAPLVEQEDVLAIVDVSASETKKIKAIALTEAALEQLPDGTVDPNKIDWDSIGSGVIDGSAIADRSLPGVKLELDTVTAAEIAPDAIGSSELAAGAVDTDAIQDYAITGIKIASNTLEARHHRTNSITSNALAPNSVGEEELADNAVDTAAIQNRAVTADKLVADLDGDAILANGSVDSAIGNNSINADKLQSSSVTTDKIATGAVTDVKISNVSGSKLHNLSVTNEKLAPGIDGGKLVDGSVTDEKVADGIDGRKLQDESVEPIKILGQFDENYIVPNSITSISLAPNAVGETELADNAVDTAALQNGSVTNPKLADGAVSDDKISGVSGSKLDADSVPNSALQSGIEGSKLVDGSVTDAKLASGIDGGKISAGTVTDTQLADGINGGKITDGTITDAELAAGIDGNKLTNGSTPVGKLDPTGFSHGIELDGTVKHTNAIAAGTANGIVYDAQGHITGTTDIEPTELPIATTTEVGVVSVPPESGLTVSSTGALDHADTIAPGTATKVTFNSHGHITGTSSIEGTDLPPATTTTLGAVIVPDTGNNPLTVDGQGNLRHSASNISPGTYVSLTVDNYGHVQAGEEVLEVDQVPGLPADKITSGQFGPNRIEDGAISAIKLGDYSTCLMQEAFPGNSPEYFLGMFWYQPSTAQLRVYARGSGPQNIWLPVGFGLLQQQNLRFAFTFDATTSTIVSITQYGAPLGLAVGDPIPVATDQLAGAYGVCVTAGAGITLHDVNGTNFTVGDWILCAGEVAGWQHIDVADGAGGGGGNPLFLNDLLDVDTTIRVPEDGDILKYNANIGQWVAVPDSANAAVGNTPPSNATSGAMWWDTESGRLMVWYDDGDTEQWVVATPESGLTGGFPPTLPDLKVLNDLEDVEAGKFHGALLIYNAGNLRWESTTVINGGVWSGIREMAEAPALPASDQPKVLNDLLDVNAANIDKAFLQYDDGQDLWVEQLGFDGGVYGIIRDVEDYVDPSVIGTAVVEKLNDLQDVNVREIDEAYVQYNDNLNYWEETTTIDGGNW